MLRKILFSSALLLEGCTMSFQKTGASDADYKRDKTDCRTQMGQARVEGLIQQRDFMRECMEGRGWTVVE